MPEKYKDINNGKDLKIYPLKIDKHKLGEISKYPLCDIPHLILLIGRVKAGKTAIINNLYLSSRMYGNDFQIKILVSPSAYNDAQNQHLINNFDFIFTEYNDDLLEELIDMIKEDESDDKYLIVFDDIVGQNMGDKKSGKTDAITSLSTLYRHVGNEKVEGKLSICIAVQYFKHINPILRNQASGIYICGHYTDTELKKIAEAYAFFGGSDNEFKKLYKKCKKDTYDFLFLNVNSMEARRNHDEILWCYKDYIKQNKEP